MRILWTVLLAAVWAGSLPAQAVPGAQVRYVAHERVMAQGTLVRLSADSVVIADSVQRTEHGRFAGYDYRERGYPRTSQTYVQHTAGSRSHGDVGALVGGGIGFAIGAVLVSSLAAANETSSSHAGPVAVAVGGGLLFAIPGALLGAGIGALSRTTNWETIDPARADFSASIAPAPGGVSIGLRVGF